MKKMLVSLLLSVFPSLLLADSLTPPAGDLSVSYLATIFGVVDGVLHGTGSQILGTMLGSFNAAVLVMASVILTYALFISILNTSHQGEFLGQKWSSIWVPLRMVSGVGLLLPKATGYSFIQILVMWVVVQGVGAADQVWKVALDYMNRNGTVVEPVQGLGPKDGSSADNTFLVSKAGSILKSEVCMYTLYNGLVRQYAPKGIEVPNFANSLTVTGKGPNGANTGKIIDYTKDKGGFITFPGKLDGTFAKYEGACGSVNWDFIGKADNEQVANPAKLTANDSASIGVRQMTLDLSALAQNIAAKLAPSSINDKPSSVKLKKDDPLFVSDGLVYTSADYFAIVKPALRALQSDANTHLKDFIKDAKKVGWVLAGSYYYQMAKLNESLRKINDLSIIKDQIAPEFKPNYDGSIFQDINDPVILANLKNNVPVSQGVIDDYIQTETGKAGDQDGNNQLFPSTGGDVSGTSGLLRQFLGSTFESVQGFQKKLQDGLNSGSDPIITLSGIGDDLVWLVETVWVSFFSIMTVLVVAGGVAGAAVSFFAPAGPIIAFLGALFGFIGLFMPIFTFWLMINLSLGATLAYYVPLIPFILFTFGVVTWFAIVLEAVIAAPLVALGITHPEGHDFLGKAEQAVMLLASVFLRPMLMVFGFIFGIILSYISISLLNQGLSIALRFMEGVGHGIHGDFLSLVSQTTLMIVYTGVILALVNRSFSMIYEVPNKVMRWIGHHPESTPEEGMLHQIRGQVDSSMREIGNMGSQGIQAAQQSVVKNAGAFGRQLSDNKNRLAKGSTVTPNTDNTPPQ